MIFTLLTFLLLTNNIFCNNTNYSEYNIIACYQLLQIYITINILLPIEINYWDYFFDIFRLSLWDYPILPFFKKVLINVWCTT